MLTVCLTGRHHGRMMHFMLNKIPSSWQQSVFSPWLGNTLLVIPRKQEGIYHSASLTESRVVIARNPCWDPGDVDIYKRDALIPSSVQFDQYLLKNTTLDNMLLNLVCLSEENIHDTRMRLLVATRKGRKGLARPMCNTSELQ